MIIRLSGNETVGQRSKVQVGFLVRELRKLLELIKDDSEALNGLRLDLKDLEARVEAARYAVQQAQWRKKNGLD